MIFWSGFVHKIIPVKKFLSLNDTNRLLQLYTSRFKAHWKKKGPKARIFNIFMLYLSICNKIVSNKNISNKNLSNKIFSVNVNIRC